MEIIFSKHSLEQLKVRSNITRAMVIETVQNADKTVPSYRDRQVYQQRYGTEVLEVVAVKEDNKLVVITQYFLEQ